MKWIKVKDHFPEERKKVLGIYAAGVSGAEIISVLWSKEWGWTSEFNTKEPLMITYWSDMPEVPEKFWE